MERSWNDMYESLFGTVSIWKHCLLLWPGVLAALVYDMLLIYDLFPIYVYQLLQKEEQLSQQERELQKKDAEVQSTKRELSEARGNLQHLEQQQKESCTLKSELEIER